MLQDDAMCSSDTDTAPEEIDAMCGSDTDSAAEDIDAMCGSDTDSAPEEIDDAFACGSTLSPLSSLAPSLSVSPSSAASTPCSSLSQLPSVCSIVAKEHSYLHNRRQSNSPSNYRRKMKSLQDNLRRKTKKIKSLEDNISLVRYKTTGASAE